MKVVFKKDENDPKTDFPSLKSGDLFTFADPRACKSEVYMKLAPSKNKDYSSIDVVSLETGKFDSFYNVKREVITVDQEYVYRLTASLQVTV